MDNRNGRIKYDRTTLLLISKNRSNLKKFDPEKRGFPDLVKDYMDPPGKVKPVTKPQTFTNNATPIPSWRSESRPQTNDSPLHPNLNGASILGLLNWGAGGIMIPPPPPGLTHPGVQAKVEFPMKRVQHRQMDTLEMEDGWKSRSSSVPSPSSINQKDDAATITKTVINIASKMLNKLNTGNYLDIMSQFVALPLHDKEELMGGVIGVIYDKALEKPSLSGEYASILQAMHKSTPDTSGKLRKLLLAQVQQSSKSLLQMYEPEIQELSQRLAGSTDDDTTRQQLKLELEEKQYLRRRRSLANAMFIGELFKLQLVTPKVIVKRVHSMLYMPTGENLEALCLLLSSIGQLLDTTFKSLLKQASLGGNMGAPPPFIPEANWFDKIFGRLEALSQDEQKFSSGVRSSILELIELRKCDWKRMNMVGVGEKSALETKIDPVTEAVNKVDTVACNTDPVDTHSPALEGLSICEDVLNLELTNVASTLQRLSSQHGFDDNLERKRKLLQYIRECAQTMKSIVITQIN